MTRTIGKAVQEFRRSSTEPADCPHQRFSRHDNDRSHQRHMRHSGGTARSIWSDQGSSRSRRRTARRFLKGRSIHQRLPDYQSPRTLTNTDHSLRWPCPLFEIRMTRMTRDLRTCLRRFHVSWPFARDETHPPKHVCPISRKVAKTR